MSQTDLTDKEFLLKLVSLLGVILLSALRIIYKDYRKKQFLKELIRRKSARNIERQNELLKIAMQSYATGPVPTFKDLVNNTENNWTVPLSEEGFDDKTE